MMILDELIKYCEKREVGCPEMYHIACNLQLLKDIITSPNCNDCADRAKCALVPDYGERVRYNCAFWREK